MKISSNENVNNILAELGQRIKQNRISLNITQAELAEKCGISPSTVNRIENGEDSKMSNYIKILSGLNMLGNLDILIPEVQPDFKALYEQKTARKRAKSGDKKTASNWTWDEDK
ncbi:MAG: helix-turn-helix transcriptional regulator [Clostridia bacterium]|nr:helix-turn-helix transcriptional regulator [Clostridia bacterium]